MFKVSCDEVTAEALTVAFETGGTAVDADYTLYSGTPQQEIDGQVTIPAGKESVTVVLVPEDDNLLEYDESAVLTLKDNQEKPTYEIKPGQGSDTATIFSDDEKFKVSNLDVTELDGEVWATISVDGDGTFGDDFSLIWETENGTAISPGDYTAGTDSLTLGAFHEEEKIPLEIIHDDVDGEEDEEFYVNLTSGDSGVDSLKRGTIKISDFGIDIDVDSNNDGEIDENNDGEDDPIEEDAPGKRIFANTDDDNKNGLADRIDGRTVYTDEGATDNDFAEVKVAYHLPSGFDASGYKLRLSTNLTLFASKDKQALWLPGEDEFTAASPLTSEELEGTTYSEAYEWYLSESPTLPTIYAEGKSPRAAEVVWEMIEMASGDVVSSDVAKINVEKIVWPSNETDEGWEEGATDGWNGFELADGWWIDKSLEDFISKPGTIGGIRTEYPEKTSDPTAPDVWEGTARQCSDATIELPISGEFKMELTYAFDNTTHNSGEYRPHPTRLLRQ